MKYVSPALVALWVSIGYAQGPSIQWTRQLGGMFEDEAYAILQTPDSCYIITGLSNYYACYSYEVYLAKLDPEGNVIWEKFLGDQDIQEKGFDVKQTTDLGYIITGTSAPGGDEQVYLIKTDSLGNVIWSRTYGGGWMDGGQSVQQTNDGGYIVTGWTRSFSSDMQVYLVKIDSAGDTMWTRTYGGSDDDFGWSVLQANDNGFIVAGWTQTAYPSGDDDYYLIKINALGDTLWTRSYGDDTTQDRACSITETSDGGYIVSGIGALYNTWLMRMNSNGDSLWTKTYAPNCNTVWELPGDNGFIVGGSFEGDMSLIRTDNDGELLWTESYGTRDLDYCNSVIIASDGGYVMVGKTFWGSTTGYPDILIIKTIPDLFGIEEQKAVKYNLASISVSPNPSHGWCRIYYSVPRVKRIRIVINDVLGRTVKNFDCNNDKLADICIWNGDDNTGRPLPSGIYFITLQTDNIRETKKVLMFR